MSDTVVVGDRIRFSVALLRQMFNEPAHLSVTVEVVEVREQADGVKWLVLRRADVQGRDE